MNDEGSPKRALRLTFEYDGRAVKQLDQQSEAMTVVTSDATEGYEGHSGFWYELQNDAGKTLYRRIVNDPTLPYREVPSPDGHFTHVATPDETRTFQVLVPDVKDGAHVVFFGPEHPRATPIGTVTAERSRARQARIGTGAAREIARFQLRNNS